MAYGPTIVAAFASKNENDATELRTIMNEMIRASPQRNRVLGDDGEIGDGGVVLVVLFTVVAEVSFSFFCISLVVWFILLWFWFRRILDLFVFKSCYFSANSLCLLRCHVLKL